LKQDKNIMSASDTQGGHNEVISAVIDLTANVKRINRVTGADRSSNLFNEH